MRSTLLAITLGLGLMLATSATAATLYAISGDANGIPRQLSAFAPTGPASPLFDLGDGSVGFTGGLAYSASAGAFYTIGSDSLGASSLYSFDLTGTLSLQFSLGDGFFGGLAWDPSDGSLYAAQNDSNGNSSLYRLDPVAQTSTLLYSVPQGLTGGLTYNSADGGLYGVINDPMGDSSLLRIDISNGLVTTVNAVLGTGFLGGIAYDASTGGYYGVNMDMFGGSTLTSIITGAPGSITPGPVLGYGYAAAGLSYGPATPASAVPEPASWLLSAVSLGLLAWRRRLS